MGMSASQARLLTITGRLTDNELRSQTITNSKLRLAQKSSEASQIYMDALNTEKLTYKYYNDNGESASYNLTPALIYSYEPLKNQYSIQNASGQNLVSATDANHFENSTTLSEFLKSYGLTEISQDYKKFLADMDDYNEKLNKYNIDKAKYDEDMVKYIQDYNAWLAQKDKPDLYKQFSDLVGTSDNPKAICYSIALNGGADCYKHILANLLGMTSNASPQKDLIASNGEHVTVSGADWYSNGDFGDIPEEMKNPDRLCDKDDYYDANDLDNKENLLQIALDAGREPTELEILKSDYVYDKENKCVKKNDKGEPQLKTLKQKAIDLFYIIKNGLITDKAEMRETLVNFTDGDMKNLTGPKPEMPDKPVLPVKPDKPKFEFTVNDKDKGQWYINLWYMMNGSETANKIKQNVDVDGNTIFTVEDTDKNKNAQNYKVIDDQLLTSNEWLTFALKNGIVTLRQASYFNPATDSGKVAELNSEGYFWNSTAYSSTTDIVAVEDEVAIAKAEVKYKNTTTEIENQDKKFDQDLKKLDTEHNALQTEYEALKSVIDKNVDRSFKAFS